MHDPVNHPLISVIIPTYNRQAYLVEAVESVLAQSYSPLELIVIDDGSTDSTDQAMHRYAPTVRYHWQTNQGVSTARNQGIALAQGEYLAFLDSDDLWTPDKLARQMAAFVATPDTDAVFSHIGHFFSPELPDDLRARLWCPEEPLPAYLLTTMLIKRTTFLQVGWLETDLQSAEGVSWIVRAQEAALRMLMLPDCLYLRRIHAANKGAVRAETVRPLARILKGVLERRRQAEAAP